MSKDAYYFSHDTNACNDPKIKALIKAYGIEGYGRFWIIIETMAEQSDHRLQHKQWQMDALAMAMLCDTDTVTEFINSCINQFELFESDGTFFWSASLTRRMNIKEEKKKKRIEAGKKGAENRWKDGNGEQSHSNGVAKHGKGKESKGKESKGKESKVKDLYLEWVYLAPEEYQRLVKEYGEPATKRMIEILDNYIGQNPKKNNRYTDHNRTIRNWVVQRYKEEQEKKNTQQPKTLDDLAPPH